MNNNTTTYTPSSTPLTERRATPVKNCIETSMLLYFKKLDGEKPVDLYNMVIGQAEYALLKSVMEHTRGNQSKAAECLGINRGTLRKKLKEHKLHL